MSKTPAKSARPLFIGVADLPPILRQAFKNIVLAALFVGNGSPNFNEVFDYLKEELAIEEKIKIENKNKF